MSQSCKEIAKTLYDCMKEQECMKKGGDVRNCMKDHPDECPEFRNAYFTCKRSQLDMRTRIKGTQVY